MLVNVKLFKKFLNFIFDLLYISTTKGFHCYNCIHTNSVPWINSSLLIYSPFPSSPVSQIVFGGFHYAVFICEYVVYFHFLHPSVSFPLPLPSLTERRKVPHIHLCPIIVITTTTTTTTTLGLGSTNECEHVLFGLLRLTYHT
jgi:hypothetical protein